MAIKSAGTYMQLSNLCKRCSKQSFCGNGMTDYFCTGYEPQVKTASDIKVPPFTDGQKEVIEAIEKHKEKCKEIEMKINKYGHKNICDVDGIDDDITDIKELLNDTIKRIEEPTNYDWLRSLNTEEMAEFIRKQRDDWSDGWYSDWHPFSEIIEWLKQPHTAK